MLIPSLYATSPRARSLRPVRVPSDQNTRWRLPFHFPPTKDNIFLSPHICQKDKDRYIHFIFEVEYSPRRRTRATEWRLYWGPCGLNFVFVWFVCVFMCLLLICLSCCYLLICFKYFTPTVHALYRTVSSITYFDFWEAHTSLKLGGVLAIYPMTIGQGSDAWNTQLISECLLGNGGHTCLNCSLQRPHTVFMKNVTGQIWDPFKTR